jgi:hypothetical protein
MPGEDNNMLETTGWIPFDRSDFVADWRKVNSEELEFCKKDKNASIWIDAYGRYMLSAGIYHSSMKKIFRYRMD